MDEDIRPIKVKLEDHIINATDEDGEERLRLAVTIEGHEVLIRFPSWNNWDFFYHSFGELMYRIAQTGGEIELDSSLIPDEHFQKWALVMSEVLKWKECRDLVGKIFFEYVRYEIPSLPIPEPLPEQYGNKKGYLRAWLMDNMGMEHIYFMFASIIQLDHWFKKKAQTMLRVVYQTQIQPSSKDTSQKNSIPEPPRSPPGALLELD